MMPENVQEKSMPITRVKGRKSNTVPTVQVGVGITLPLYEKFKKIAEEISIEKDGAYCSVAGLLRQAAIEKYFPVKADTNRTISKPLE